MRHLELVEDAVRGAFLGALTTWTARGLPEDPSAWLYRVAYNNLAGDLRRAARRLRILERAVDAGAGSGDDPTLSYDAGDVADDLLRMLFICCDDAIPRESRLVLALKTLCGFSALELVDLARGDFLELRAHRVARFELGAVHQDGHRPRAPLAGRRC